MSSDIFFHIYSNVWSNNQITLYVISNLLIAVSSFFMLIYYIKHRVHKKRATAITMTLFWFSLTLHSISEAMSLWYIYPYIHLYKAFIAGVIGIISVIFIYSDDD